jgi:hypothetical protein
VQVPAYRIRWTGRVIASHSEAFTFHAIHDDGVRVWLGGQLIIDDWATEKARETSSTPVLLEAGRAYDLKVEYFNSLREGVMKLSWSSRSQSKGIIPTSRLVPVVP